MNVMRKNTLDAPSSGRFDQLIARHRGALAMLAASLSLNSVACGGGNNDHEIPEGAVALAAVPVKGNGRGRRKCRRRRYGWRGRGSRSRWKRWRGRH